MFLINSIRITVLPTPAPPNNPTLLPLANGQIKSTTLIPVSSNCTSDACSAKVGGALCIGIVESDLIGPLLSIGSPKTFIIRPRVPFPTGTLIGAPVFLTSRPLFNPSVVPMAIVLTIPSPICCCTSRVKPPSSTKRASYMFGIESRENCTSITAPIISTTLPISI